MGKNGSSKRCTWHFVQDGDDPSSCSCPQASQVMMCRDSEALPIPPSLLVPEQQGLLDRFPIGAPLPHSGTIILIDATDFVPTGVHMDADDLKEVEIDLMRWGLARFSFNYDTNMDDRTCNHHAGAFRTIQKASFNVARTMQKFRTLGLSFHGSGEKKEQCKSSELLDYHFMEAEKKKACKEYLDYLLMLGASSKVAQIFQPRNYTIMGNISEIKLSPGPHAVRGMQFIIPRWWSHKMVAFVEYVESRSRFCAKSRTDSPGKILSIRNYVTSSSTEYGFITRHLPSDLYSVEFKEYLLPNEIVELKMKAPILPAIGNMASLFPRHDEEFLTPPLNHLENDVYLSDDDVSCDEMDDSENEIDITTMSAEQNAIKDAEDRFKTQIAKLQEDLQDVITNFSNFKSNIQDSLPKRLEELEKARNDIEKIISKLDALKVQRANIGEGCSVDINDTESTIDAGV
ncbi:uncharacterized protein MELLADRAFT_101677 [Melampsora larici-populina 98AG31]|uniref:Uncharacterized protein n=1 Tax=Melampsora larici-populina (strain 98AG31 / pathotype 3-4-7) TaxID=747676 RepID=F4R6M0_MELLP|nr:uncharacterized protein MELLADRAFT_101677 [Melampsora larici-populina 98AG31]EGG12438.1 hypothetical protein MELLADRAFT_101677 [Melampsora larici-populina 98AG31]